MRWPHPIYVASTILFLIAIHIFAASPPIPRFGQWLHDWQDLVAGVLALLGAYWALIGIRQQIDISEKQERQRLWRQHNAVRATLPLTLNSICAWCRAMALELDGAHAKLQGAEPEALIRVFQPPALPNDRVAEVQEFIRSTDDKALIALLSHVIREMQVLWARISDLNDEREMANRARVERNIETYIIQVAKIYALAASLFGYSREETQAGPTEVGWDLVEIFLMSSHLMTPSRRDVISRAIATDPSFWKLGESYWTRP